MSNANPKWDPPGVGYDYRQQGEQLVCTTCGRRWYVGPSRKLSDENFNYMIEHRDLHRRDQADRRRPKQQWHS